MIRALLLAACLATAAAFMTQPGVDPSCVDVSPEEIQRLFQISVEAGDIKEGTPDHHIMGTITTCADVEAIGGCEDPLATEACCASCEDPESERQSRAFWTRRRRRRRYVIESGVVEQGFHDGVQWTANMFSGWG